MYYYVNKRHGVIIMTDTYNKTLEELQNEIAAIFDGSFEEIVDNKTILEES